MIPAAVEWTTWPGLRGDSSFRVEGQGQILLGQVGAKRFRLASEIRYQGTTGLESEVRAGNITQPTLDMAKRVDGTSLPNTDLASVPASLRWFVGRYGVHTPAALIHDRLIGDNGAPLDQITDAGADRYFRFMLRDLGIPWLRRWLMWAAVALGTRFRRGGVPQALLLLWVLASTAGIALFVLALVLGEWWLVVISALIPIPAAVFWGAQWRAGILGAYLAPVILPPTLLGALGHAGYVVLESLVWLVGKLRLDEAPPPPVRYDKY